MLGHAQFGSNGVDKSHFVGFIQEARLRGWGGGAPSGGEAKQRFAINRPGNVSLTTKHFMCYDQRSNVDEHLVRQHFPTTFPNDMLWVSFFPAAFCDFRISRQYSSIPKISAQGLMRPGAQ